MFELDTGFVPPDWNDPNIIPVFEAWFETHTKGGAPWNIPTPPRICRV